MNLFIAFHAHNSGVNLLLWVRVRQLSDPRGKGAKPTPAGTEHHSKQVLPKGTCMGNATFGCLLVKFIVIYAHFPEQRTVVRKQCSYQPAAHFTKIKTRIARHQHADSDARTIEC